MYNQGALKVCGCDVIQAETGKDTSAASAAGGGGGELSIPVPPSTHNLATVASQDGHWPGDKKRPQSQRVRQSPPHPAATPVQPAKARVKATLNPNAPNRPIATCRCCVI